MIHGDACFAYFNKIWGIPDAVPPFFKTSASPRPSERNIETASYWFCLHFPQIEKVRNPT